MFILKSTWFTQKIRRCILLACLMAGTAMLVPAALEAQEAPIRVRLAGLASNRGTIRIAVFNRAEGFPASQNKATKLLTLPAQKGQLEFSLKGMTNGQYAIAVYHDENNDGQLNTNLLGIPQEGYAFSNNVRPKFSAPSFEQTAFRVSEAGQQLDIRVKY